jgi:nicotinamidase-related amidase
MSAKPLLLCVDMQAVFVRVVAHGEEIYRRWVFAISAAKGLGMEVLFTEQAPQKLGTTIPELLALVETPVVRGKTAFSALAPESALFASLGSNRQIVICGVETPICVFQTASDALAAGHSVTILSDCVGARREADALVCLEYLARAGARVIPSETYFYSVMKDATHPFFRTYTQLVKHHG